MCFSGKARPRTPAEPTSPIPEAADNMQHADGEAAVSYPFFRQLWTSTFMVITAHPKIPRAETVIRENPEFMRDGTHDSFFFSWWGRKGPIFHDTNERVKNTVYFYFFFLRTNTIALPIRHLPLLYVAKKPGNLALRLLYTFIKSRFDIQILQYLSTLATT